MTALAGCVGVSGADRGTCEAMLALQRPYGTDAPKFASCDGATFGRLPNDRLAEDRFDQQPLLTDRYLIVADVRLDNRDDLLRSLGIGDAEGAGLCDSDLLLRAWMRWQDGSPERLIGDYAFAVLERRERKLHLVRDATGQRPLFFARSATSIAFSSMPSGLFAAPFVTKQFRFDTLASMLVGQPDLSDVSYFKDIFRVRPGHIALFASGSVRQQRYWRPPSDPLRLSPEEYVEAYRECLDRAVSAHLRRRSGRLGAHLSSGYDSSAVASTAARLAPNEELIAFTSAPRLGFDGPVPRNRTGDESEIAAATARMHGMKHLVVRPTTGMLSCLRDHARLYQEPDRNLANMEWCSSILRSARDLGVSTLLNGQMGNLTIHDGGLPILAEWVRTGAWLRWWKEARSVAQRPNVRWRGILINSFGAWLPEALRHGLDRAFLDIPPITRQSFLRDHWLWRVHHSARESAIRDQGSYQHRRQRIGVQEFGVYRKGVLAESGIDERDPLSDRRLIDFSFTLPPEQLLHKSESRPLACRALAGQLPAAVLQPQLRGYQGADWYERLERSNARELIEEVSTCSAVNELLDLGKMRKAVDDWPSAGTPNLGQQVIYRNRLTVALSTAVFIQEFSEPYR